MNAAIDLLNRAGELWWRYAPHMVWQASLVAVLVLVAVRLGRRWPSPLRYWLLVIALVKFAMPPLLSLPVGVFSRIGPQVKPIEGRPPIAVSMHSTTPSGPALTRPADVAPQPVDNGPTPSGPGDELAPPTVDNEFVLPAEDPPTDDDTHPFHNNTPERVAGNGASMADEREDPAIDVAAVEPATPVASSVEATPTIAPSRASVQWKAWLFLAHALGCLVVAAWIIGQLIALQRAIRAASVLKEGPLYERFVAIWRGMSPRRASRRGHVSQRRMPRLLVSGEPVAPMTVGLIRTAVVLPSAAADSLAPDQLDGVLAHELAHIRRRDTWLNWFQLLLTALWWFNPVLWLLNRAVRKVREECCDDTVLAGASSSNDAYCETLVHAASRLAVCKPVGARLGFADRLHPLGARLKRIMDRTLRRAPALTASGIVFITVLAVVLLPGLGCRRAEKEPDKQANAADAEKWQALLDEQQKIIDQYQAQLERLRQDTGTAKVLAEQVAYFERKLAEEQAKLLTASAQFGPEHPEVKALQKTIGFYQQKLDEARQRLAATSTESAALGPVEPGSHPELNQTLLDAASEGNLAGVKSLLARGAYVDTRDDKGNTPLWLAIERGHEPTATFLIDNGADIQVHDVGNNTPLHWAARYGQKDVVRRLLERGADIEAQAAFSDTPLVSALRTGHADIAKLLLDHGAKLNLQGERLSALALDAAYNGHIDTLGFLFEHGFDPSAAEALALLDAAAVGGHVDMLRLLVDHGATLSAADAQATARWLLSALTNGRLAAATFLLEHGADPNARDASDRHPLLTVFSYGPRGVYPPDVAMPNVPPGPAPDEFVKDAVKLLIDHKVDVNAKDHEGRTALWLAA